jgi:hypothetical protein
LGVRGQIHAPAALPPGKEPRYPLDRRLGGPKREEYRTDKKYCDVKPHVDEGVDDNAVVSEMPTLLKKMIFGRTARNMIILELLIINMIRFDSDKSDTVRITLRLAVYRQ